MIMNDWVEKNGIRLGLYKHRVSSSELSISICKCQIPLSNHLVVHRGHVKAKI
jgi:hypothetical protein